MNDKPETTVLFNATCPVCNFEIRHYETYANNKGLPIRFDDLNSPALAAWGLDADTAARRLYVLHNGQLTSGIPAFIILWAQMPRYHWLSKLAALPIVKAIFVFGYDHLLAPAIYHWHLYRLRRTAKPVSGIK